MGVAGASGNLPLPFEDGFTGSCLRGAGDGDVCRVLLRGLSRSAGSLYEVGGLLGLRDWYRCSLGGTACFSAGDGVGDREETCVMVGETAAGPRSQYTTSEVQKENAEWRGNVISSHVLYVRGEAWAGPGRERDRCICIMAPSGGGLASISSSAALRCQCKQTRWTDSEVGDVARCSRNQGEAAEAVARLAVDYAGRQIR